MANFTDDFDRTLTDLAKSRAAAAAAHTRADEAEARVEVLHRIFAQREHIESSGLDGGSPRQFKTDATNKDGMSVGLGSILEAEVADKAVAIVKEREEQTAHIIDLQTRCDAATHRAQDLQAQ